MSDLSDICSVGYPSTLWRRVFGKTFNCAHCCDEMEHQLWILLKMSKNHRFLCQILGNQKESVDYELNRFLNRNRNLFGRSVNRLSETILSWNCAYPVCVPITEYRKSSSLSKRCGGSDLIVTHWCGYDTPTRIWPECINKTIILCSGENLEFRGKNVSAMHSKHGLSVV